MEPCRVGTRKEGYAKKKKKEKKENANYLGYSWFLNGNLLPQIVIKSD